MSALSPRLPQPCLFGKLYLSPCRRLGAFPPGCQGISDPDLPLSAGYWLFDPLASFPPCISFLGLCYNKLTQIGWLQIAEMYCPHSTARSTQSRYYEGHTPSEGTRSIRSMPLSHFLVATGIPWLVDALFQPSILSVFCVSP